MAESYKFNPKRMTLSTTRISQVQVTTTMEVVNSQPIVESGLTWFTSMVNYWERNQSETVEFMYNQVWAPPEKKPFALIDYQASS